MMPRVGGREVGQHWNPTLEVWFTSNPQMILKYPYSHVAFRGDADMGLPPGDD